MDAFGSCALILIHVYFVRILFLFSNIPATNTVLRHWKFYTNFHVDGSTRNILLFLANPRAIFLPSFITSCVSFHAYSYISTLMGRHFGVNFRIQERSLNESYLFSSSVQFVVSLTRGCKIGNISFVIINFKSVSIISRREINILATSYRNYQILQVSSLSFSSFPPANRISSF